MGEGGADGGGGAGGGWLKHTGRHPGADLIRAVIEGVSYSQKDCLRIIEELGVPVDSIRASGGGARSAFWRQILADVFKKNVATLQTQEGSAYGAALLALVGTGEYTSVPEACRACIREASSVAPRAQDAARCAQTYETYRALYPALRPLYAAMAD